MNAVFGLLVWQGLMAVLGGYLYLWKRRALRDREQGLGLTASAAIVWSGSIFGAIPSLFLLNLLGPFERLLMFGAPLVVAGVGISIVVDRAQWKDAGRLGRGAPD